MELLLLLFLLGGVVVLMLIAWRMHKLRRGAQLAGDGWLDRAAIAWHRSAEAHRAREAAARIAKARTSEQVDARARDARRASIMADPPAPPLPSPDYRDAHEVVEEIYLAEVDLRAGLIDHEALMLLIADARARLSDLKRDLRQDLDNGAMDDDEYDDALADLDDIRDEVRDIESRWRASEGWDFTEAADPRWAAVASGKWARFDYVDHDGEVSSRDISNWESRGRYIVGFCRAARAERTFRKVRISEWKSG